MAGLSELASSALPVVSSCCSTKKQAGCCTPSEKVKCCPPNAGGCGCQAGRKN